MLADSDNVLADSDVMCLLTQRRASADSEARAC